MNKQAKQLVKQVTAHKGWDYRRRRNSHGVFIGPKGERVFCSSTPSDRKAIRNIIRDLKREGFPGEIEVKS